jgi:hypothetical protein
MVLRNNFRFEFYTGIGLCLFLAYILLVPRWQKRTVMNWSFSGSITDIYYNPKGIPTIVVNKKEYDLYLVTWDFSIKLHKGDKVIKNKGDMRIKVIYLNTKDTVLFNERRFK